MRTYPTSTSNRNVPADVYLIAELAVGECNYTYYADKNGDLWKVGDWKGDKPQSAYLNDVCRLTGDCEFMVEGRVSSWIFYQNNHHLL